MMKDYSSDHHQFYGIENHFKSILDSASEIIFSIDLDGTILTWNKSAEKTLGYSYDDVKGRSLYKYLEEKKLGELKNIISRMHFTRAPTMQECKLLRKNGETSFISWVCSPIKDQYAQISGMVIVGRDMTEHRMLENRIHQSQKLAALGMMAGGIAHEIRNPLAICSSAAQFLMADDMDAEFRKECAEKIQKGMIRASGIIETLMNFARPSVKAQIEQIDLHDLMREAFAHIIKKAEARQVTIEKKFQKGSIPIIGNQSLLQHMFLNIYDNSLKAMPEGGILTVSTNTLDSEVCALITDTGYGIPEIALDKIFDPFYTSWTDGEGTGLSLSLCYAIVQEHDGHIKAESIEGRGTTISVRLPLAI